MILKKNKINIEQNKFVMNVNYFGTLNCVKSFEEYFKKKKKKDISQLYLQLQGIEDCPNSLVVFGHQRLL